LATKSERAWEGLESIDVSQPTRTNRHIDEPDIAPPPDPPQRTPPRKIEPEPDPFELVKERYRVNLPELLRWNIASTPDQEHVQEDRPTKYLMFDNYYEPVMVKGVRGIDIPLQNGEEQIIYWWFYRKSYGFGYRVCAMGQLELAHKLKWGKERVIGYIESLIVKGHIRKLEEFPPFRNYRAQIFEVMLPRKLLEDYVNNLADEKRRKVALKALEKLRRKLG